MKNITFTLLISLLAVSNTLYSAVILNSGSTYTQNFDSMGFSTTLPDDWLISFDDEFESPPNAHLNAISSVSFQASSATPTTPGTYNFASTGGVDRALGVIPDRTGPQTLSSIIQLHLNINDPTITSLEISFDSETYYIGDAFDSMILGLWSSSGTPTNWNSVTFASDPSLAAGHYFNSPPSTFASATLPSSEFALGDLYLIFQFNGMASSGLALDNVSIIAIPEPSSFTLSIFALTVLLLTKRKK